MKRDGDYNGSEKDNCMKQPGGGGGGDSTTTTKKLNILGNLQRERGEGEGQNKT